jgi:hypothetical protein
MAEWSTMPLWAHVAMAALLAVGCALVVDWLRKPRVPKRNALPSRKPLVWNAEIVEAEEKPLLSYPVGRPPSRWGPGAIISERLEDDFRFRVATAGSLMTSCAPQIAIQSTASPDVSAWQNAALNRAYANRLLQNAQQQNATIGQMTQCAQVPTAKEMDGAMQDAYRAAGLTSLLK